MDFVELITAARDYLSCFDYDHYPACFQAFEVDAAPLFDALADAQSDQAAAALINALDRNRAALPRKEQKSSAQEEKQVFALFLAPAALRRGGAAQAFAESLSAQWNARSPRNTFFPGSYDAILKGFDANLLGLPLRKSKFRR